MPDSSIRAGWGFVAGLYASLIPHLFIYRFVAGNCTSISCTTLALAQSVLFLFVLIIAFNIKSSTLTSLRRHRTAFPPILYLMIVGTILFGFGLLMRPEWVYTHMALALGGLATVGYLTLFGMHIPFISWRLVVVACGLSILLIMGLRSLSLSVFPPIQIVDEGWTMSWAISYLRTGQPSDWIVGSVSGIPYYSLPRWFGLVALWLQTTGIGIWEGRMLSLLVTTITIVLTTNAAARLFDRPTSIAVLLTLLASSVAVVGLRLRHDVGVQLALALSLWVYSFAIKRNGRTLHLLAGVCAGLSVGAHYHGLGLTVALGIGLHLPNYLDELRRGRYIPPVNALAFAFGAVLAGGSIFAWQVLPNLEQFRTYLSPRSPQSLNEFWQSFIYHIAQVPQLSSLEFVLLLTAFIAAWIRRNRLEISFALTLLLSYLVLGAMASLRYGPFDYYSVPLVPVFGLLIGRLFSGFRAPVQHATVAISCTCFLLPQLGFALSPTLNALRTNTPVRLPAPSAAQWVIENIPESETIMAENYYFLWLYEYPFLSPLTPVYDPRSRELDLTSPETFREVWAQLNPDVLIFDSTLATSGYAAPLQNPAFLEQADYLEVYTTADDTATVYWRR